MSRFDVIIAGRPPVSYLARLVTKGKRNKFLRSKFFGTKIDRQSCEAMSHK